MKIEIKAEELEPVMLQAAKMAIENVISEMKFKEEAKYTLLKNVDVANLLGCHKSYVSKLVDKGVVDNYGNVVKLKAITPVQGQLRIRLSDYHTFIDQLA